VKRVIQRKRWFKGYGSTKRLSHSCGSGTVYLNSRDYEIMGGASPGKDLCR